jgi:hypothetical protein
MKQINNEYFQQVTNAELTGDLAIGTKSLALTLSSGTGSVPIPDTAHLIGVKPVSSTAIRVGLEAPEADGAATGAVVAGDLKKGCPIDAAVWTWFSVGYGTGRTLYVKGGTSDVVEVVVM